jgi:hypothetical protein
MSTTFENYVYLEFVVSKNTYKTKIKIKKKEEKEEGKKGKRKRLHIKNNY